MDRDDITNRLDSAFDKLCLASYANKLPTFSGERGAGGFMQFLEKFREIASIMGLTENKSVLLLPAHLGRDRESKILDAYPNTQSSAERKFLQSMVFTNALANPIKQRLKLLGPLPTNYDKLVQDAERMWNLTKTDPDSLGEGVLIAKMDRVLDQISATRNFVTTNSAYTPKPNALSFRNSSRPYNSKYQPRAIISLYITPITAYSLQYQLCAAGKSGWPIAYPDPLQCTTSPNTSDILLTSANLYVERTEPLLIPAYHCFNKTRKICASSYLHVSFSVNSDEESMTPIDPCPCKTITQTKKYMGIPLEPLSHNVFGSENQVHYSYPWFFGEKCTLTTNLYYEQGEIATFDGEHLIGQFGNMAPLQHWQKPMFSVHTAPLYGTVQQWIPHSADSLKQLKE
ncbi:hypothetical protein OSTOST_14415 [Ostertagia ostertagi]